MKVNIIFAVILLKFSSVEPKIDFSFDDLNLSTITNQLSNMDKHRLEMWLQVANNIPFLSTPKLENNNNITEQDVKLYLYTRKTSLKGVVIRNVSDFSHISGKSPLKIIIHGWTEHYDVEWAKNMTRAYLKKASYNVLIPDWSSKGDADYVSASGSVKKVGEIIGDILIAIHDSQGIDYSSMHLISHSLGAHVAGIIGQRVLARTGILLARITALDPAAPIFDMFTMGKDTRLSPDDAEFVDIIHTDGGRLGFRSSLGTADFFPNGGIATQPGCSLMRPDVKYEDLFCSHAISHRFYTYSINNNKLWASSCNSYDVFLKGNCDSHSRTLFGENTFTNISGNYYIRTKSVNVFQ